MVEIRDMGIGKKGIRFIAVALFIGLVVALSVHFTPQVKDLFARREQLKLAVTQSGARGIAAFIGLQIFQVVVATVPGEIVQVAAGYFFGTFLGSLYLVGGLVLGTILAFFTARFLGSTLVNTFVPETKRVGLIKYVSGAKSELALFILYLLPGLPKDVLTYFAGLTPVNPWRFLLISILGRLPALVVSCYIGAGLRQENLKAVAVTAVLSALLLLGGVLCRGPIMDRVRRR